MHMLQPMSCFQIANVRTTISSYPELKRVEKFWNHSHKPIIFRALFNLMTSLVGFE